MEQLENDILDNGFHQLKLIQRMQQVRIRIIKIR